MVISLYTLNLYTEKLHEHFEKMFDRIYVDLIPLLLQDMFFFFI